jgi:DNA-binding GntR family transcriptional regulator
MSYNEMAKERLYVKRINQSLIRESAFTELRKMILSQEIKPGEKLNEKEVAEQLGVSRTPVREAFHKLELEGLVEIFPRRYCLVKGVTHSCIREIHLIRSQLEPMAAYHAVDHLTDESLEELTMLIHRTKELMDEGNAQRIMELNDRFHRTINEASNLPRIVSILSNMQDYIESFRYSFISRPELAQRSINEHEEILAALKERNKELVKMLVSKHLEGIAEYEDVILDDLKPIPYF